MSGWRRWVVPAIVFAAILAHGGTIGLTDDEAYYWVLGRHPALGYAFHPPAIGLSVALSHALFGWLLGQYSVILVRLPAAFCAAAMVALGAEWVARSGDAASRAGAGGSRVSAGAMIAAFGGIFALSWMIVPDYPMFLGWTGAYLATWVLCFDRELRRPLLWEAALCLFTALCLLGKYSGVLAGVSALAAVWLWAPRERRMRATAALALGGVLAAAPILWWNSRHAWGSLLYQLRERHGEAHLSLARYGRFWAVELVLLGPALAAYGAGLAWRALRGQGTRAERFALAWALPGVLVFCSQPLWADFKPHWALVAWWPLALAFAGEFVAGRVGGRLSRLHLGYGYLLIALVWVSCHVPVLSYAESFFKDPAALDPKMDVTNDLYGWAGFRNDVVATEGEAALSVPFVGSRYQTASQAAFALGPGTRATMLPRDLKALDEWPSLGVSASEGPDWPALNQPVYFVADNRYDAPPEYKDADCALARTFEARRAGFLAKKIFLWKCAPRSARP